MQAHDTSSLPTVIMRSKCKWSARPHCPTWPLWFRTYTPFFHVCLLFLITVEYLFCGNLEKAAVSLTKSLAVHRQTPWKVLELCVCVGLQGCSWALFIWASDPHVFWNSFSMSQQWNLLLVLSTSNEILLIKLLDRLRNYIVWGCFSFFFLKVFKGYIDWVRRTLSH